MIWPNIPVRAEIHFSLYEAKMCRDTRMKGKALVLYSHYGNHVGYFPRGALFLEIKGNARFNAVLTWMYESNVYQKGKLRQRLKECRGRRLNVWMETGIPPWIFIHSSTMATRLREAVEAPRWVRGEECGRGTRRKALAKGKDRDKTWGDRRMGTRTSTRMAKAKVRKILKREKCI